MGAHCVAQASLRIVAVVPVPPQCWDPDVEPPCPAPFFKIYFKAGSYYVSQAALDPESLLYVGCLVIAQKPLVQGAIHGPWQTSTVGHSPEEPPGLLLL